MSKIDQTGATWQAVLEWGADALALARDELERPSTTPDRTAYLRGRISAIRDALSLPADSAPVIITAETYGLG